MKRLLIGIAALLLFACTGTQLTEGQVIDKDYDPEYTTIKSHCVSYKDDGFTCAVSIPYADTVEAVYRLKIRGYDEKEHKIEEWHTVPEDVYNSLHRGDHWVE